jgi:hypothetical protein
LLGAAFYNIDDLLHRRVTVKLMSFSGGHADADQEKVFRLHKPRSTEPFVGAPGKLLDLDILFSDKSQQIVLRHDFLLRGKNGTTRRRGPEVNRLPRPSQGLTIRL